MKEKKKREKEASVPKYSENDDHVTLMWSYQSNLKRKRKLVVLAHVKPLKAFNILKSFKTVW